jgi:hypothetical protein
MLAFRFVTSVVAAIGYAGPNHRFKISKSMFNAKNSDLETLSLQISLKDDPNVSFSCSLLEFLLDGLLNCY